MTIIQSTQPIQAMSITDKIKQNFNERKWEILIPGPVGLAALAATVVFLLSNPFGWAISAGLLGAGIACASVNAILAIGHSISLLLKEPKQINNLVTDETIKKAEEAPKQIKQVALKFQPQELPKAVLEAPKNEEKRLVTQEPALALAPLVKEEKPQSIKGRIISLFHTIMNNPLKSALAAGLVGAGIYSFYNYPSFFPFFSSFFMNKSRALIDEGKATAGICSVNKGTSFTRAATDGICLPDVPKVKPWSWRPDFFKWADTKLAKSKQLVPFYMNKSQVLTDEGKATDGISLLDVPKVKPWNWQPDFIKWGEAKIAESK